MERQNFYRCSGLLLDVGGRVLRNVFTCYHLGSNTITAYLSSNKTKLTNLQYHFLGKEQRLKLFPPLGTTASIDNFDITLLYALFRNLDSTISSKSSVWSNPLSTDHSFQADIGRITDIRNKLYGHLDSASLDNSTFIAATRDLTDIYKRLISNLPSSHISAADLQTMIDEELSGPLQPDMEAKMAKMRVELEEWQRYDEGIKATLAVMKADMQNMQRAIQARKSFKP